MNFARIGQKIVEWFLKRNLPVLRFFAYSQSQEQPACTFPPLQPAADTTAQSNGKLEE